MATATGPEQYPLVSEEYIAKRQRVYSFFNGDDCWRCGGTGRYSWCSSFRDVCFACGGSGHTFNTVGLHGWKTYRNDRITQVPANTLKVNDPIEWEDIIIGEGAPTPITRINRVKSIKKSKKNNTVVLVFNDKEGGSHQYEYGRMMDRINEEVKMVDYRTTGNWMDNIIQVSLSECKGLKHDDTNYLMVFVAAKVPDKLPEATIVCKALAPSKDTLKVYFQKGWKGKSNPNYEEGWFDEYTPLYMADLDNDNSRKNIKAIVKNAQKGVKIYLICYCTNKNRCHTSLLKNACYDYALGAQLLEEAGVPEV